MTGTVQKKGTRWHAVVYDGIDPGTGRKRRRWNPARPTTYDLRRSIDLHVLPRLGRRPLGRERRGRGCP